MNDSNLIKKIIKVLKTIFDPELPVNVWDLGLIYGINIKNNHVIIVMTLTSPNCPAINFLPLQIETEVKNALEIENCSVELVWNPPWNKDLISEETKFELGLI